MTRESLRRGVVIVESIVTELLLERRESRVLIVDEASNYLRSILSYSQGYANAMNAIPVYKLQKIKSTRSYTPYIPPPSHMFPTTHVSHNRIKRTSMLSVGRVVVL